MAHPQWNHCGFQYGVAWWVFVNKMLKWKAWHGSTSKCVGLKVLEQSLLLGPYPKQLDKYIRRSA
jgi:hypothetical protein